MNKRSTPGIGARGDALPPDHAKVRNQLPTQAGRYLRKPANIEDLPDAEQIRKTEKPNRRIRKKKDQSSS